MSKKGNINNARSVLKEHEQQFAVFLLYSENAQKKNMRILLKYRMSLLFRSGAKCLAKIVIIIMHTNLV